jgi:hypothetical protein
MAPRNPSLFSTFLVISFSIGLVRFGTGLLNLQDADKLFFHFSKSFFERFLDLLVALDLRLAEGIGSWQAFFSLFFNVF